MRITLSAVISVLLSPLVFAQSVQIQLNPVKGKEGCGFKCTDDRVIPSQFVYAVHFSEGMARVQTKQSWGFIDTIGNLPLTGIFTCQVPGRPDASLSPKTERNTSWTFTQKNVLN